MFADAIAFALALSASVPTASSISFSEAMALADADPTVASTRNAAATLRRGADEASFFDQHPTISLALGPRLAPEAERGLEVSGAVSQSVSLAGAGTRRAQVLDAQAVATNSEVRLQQQNQRLEVAKAWLRLRAAEEHHRVSVQRVVREQEHLGFIKRLVEAQELTEGDLAVAQLAFEEARLHEREIEGTLVDAQSRLALLVRRQGQVPIQTSGPPPDPGLPEPTAWAALLESAHQMPAVTVRQHLAEAELAQAQAARASMGWRLNVGIQAQHDALGAAIVQGVIGGTLPLFNLAGPQMAQNQSNAQRLAGEAEAETRRGASQLELLHHELEHTEEIYEVLTKRVVPAAERAVELRRREMAVGEGTQINLLDAQRTSATARAKLIEAERARGWARVQVATLLAGFEKTP